MFGFLRKVVVASMSISVAQLGVGIALLPTGMAFPEMLAVSAWLLLAGLTLMSVSAAAGGTLELIAEKNKHNLPSEDDFSKERPEKTNHQAPRSSTYWLFSIIPISGLSYDHMALQAIDNMYMDEIPLMNEDNRMAQAVEYGRELTCHATSLKQ